MDSDNESAAKGRSGRGRGRGRGRPPGRSTKKSKKKSEKSVKKETTIETKVKDIDESVNTWDDIKDLKTDSMIEFDENIDSEVNKITSFVTTSSIPLHKNAPLNWKHRVNLIGEKVVNPRIHCCEKCLLPILVYGRMIACKHVFCLNCAKGHENVCPRCQEKVLRVETSGLGTVFMCQTESCKRTYLSQRDLQAHIQHRHVRRQTSSALNPTNVNLISTTCAPKDVNHSQHSNLTSNSRSASYNNSFQSPIPVVSSRSNLITVPIQEEVNSMTQSVNSQQSMIGSTQQPVSNYVSNQSPYGHHNPHLQWPAMTNNNAFNYRPPTPSWPPMNPYTNPYNRPYYPQ